MNQFLHCHKLIQLLTNELSIQWDFLQDKTFQFTTQLSDFQEAISMMEQVNVYRIFPPFEIRHPMFLPLLFASPLIFLWGLYFYRQAEGRKEKIISRFLFERKRKRSKSFRVRRELLGRFPIREHKY